VTDTAPPTATEPPRRRRELLGPTGLVVMVVAILAFTAVSIVVELVASHGRTFKATVDVVGQVPGDRNEYQVVFHVTNTGSRAGRPDTCEANLLDVRGERVGTATVTLHDPIRPGRTDDLPVIGTAASPPVNGTVQCRSLEPD
jgi:hypothetical protein